MKLHIENLKGRSITWWVGEFIAYIVPTVILILIYELNLIVYPIVSYTIAILGLGTFIMIFYIMFREIGNTYKRKFIKRKNYGNNYTADKIEKIKKQMDDSVKFEDEGLNE